MSNNSTKNLIIESNEIRDVLKHCSFDTLAAFDLDNTLITPSKVKGLGSDKWFAELYTYGSRVLADSFKAKKLTIELSDFVQNIIQFKSVEDRTNIILKLLKDVGLPVMGITARYLKSAEMTENQLKSVGISFSKLCDEVIELDVSDPMRKAYYKNGIIYCDGLNKGKCLWKFLTHLGLKCSVVMVDDTGRNLEQVLVEANTVGFSFTGLRYGRTDQLVTKFSMFKAMEKMEERVSLLPPRARKIMEELKLEQLGAVDQSPEM